MTLQLSDFTVKGELGRGSYGVVFKARHKQDGGLYVLKQVPMHNSKLEKEALKEVQILRQLSHPNIIKYQGSFVERGSLYIVMEYAEGGDLHHLIAIQKEKRRHFPEREVWRYASELVAAIAYLHQRGILHRDIKTMNVLLTKNFHVKLADLGASKLAKDLAMHLTHIGTPLFLAPEMVLRTAYDYKVDIWALGCVLYQICTFHLPFRGDNLIALGNAIVSSEPKPLPTGYSERLSCFIFRLLEKSPALRPTIEEVRKQLLERSRTEDTSVSLIEELATEITLARSIKEEPSALPVPKVQIFRPERILEVDLDSPKRPMIPVKAVEVRVATADNRRSLSIGRPKPTVRCLLDTSSGDFVTPPPRNDILQVSYEKPEPSRPCTSIGIARNGLPNLPLRRPTQDPQAQPPVKDPLRPSTSSANEALLLPLFRPPKLRHFLRPSTHLRIYSSSQTPVIKKKLGIVNLV